MRNRSSPADAPQELWEKLIGLGEESHRKSYYPELQKRLGELERFKAFLDNSHDFIFLVEVPTGRIVDFNDTASRQTGWGHDELRELSIFNVFALAGNAQASALIGAGAEIQKGWMQVETNLLRRNAEAIPAELSLSRLFFQESAYVIMVARDISERKVAEEALAERVRLAELGAEVGSALTTGKDLTDTLQRCAESLTRHTEAVFGRIWIVSKEDPEVLELKASAGLYTHIDGRHSRKRIGELKVGEIAKERRPYLSNEVIGDPGFSDQQWIKREKMVAFAGYPLVISERLVGVIALFFKKRMTKAILDTLASVADEIAVGIERQRAETALGESEKRRLRLQTQMEFAARMQKHLLPTVFPQLPGFEIAARCLPAYEVGGDFYDWQETRAGCFALTLGDIMGKGLAAAMLMATVRASLRAVAQTYPPAAALGQAERALRQDLSNAESFVTLFHGQLEVATRQLTYVDCGHGLVFMLRADGRVEELLPRGLPLGIMSEQPYQEGCVTFGKGDYLVLFSDGLMDAMQQTELDNESLAKQLWARNPQEMVDRLVKITLSDAIPPDDMTLVVVKCTSE
jgi:PAS domain S-box-containing protein